jgi:phosphatidate cytidylyltransferase
MDDQEREAGDDLDQPGIDDDLSPKPAASDAGFDGWLDDEGAAAENPYVALHDDHEGDDAEAEIADWMAFAGDRRGGTPQEEPDVVVDVTDAVVAEEGITERPGAAGERKEHDETIELLLGEEPDDDATPGAGESEAPLEVRDAPDGGDETGAGEAAVRHAAGEPERDLDELMVIPAVVPGRDTPVASKDGASDQPEAGAVPTVDAGGGAAHSDDTDEIDAPMPPLDDTGEVPVVAPFPPGDNATAEPSAVFDFEELTEEHYLHTATREHQDLAAAIAAAEGEETEQVALAAAIPGLDAGVVGFDDVVADDGVPDVKPPASSDLVLRVGTAVVLLGAFFLSLLWRPALIVLALAAFIVAAGEFYSILIHRGYKPVSIFGFLGILGAGLGTVVWGVVAIPIAFALMVTVLLLFDAVSKRRTGAVSGFATTIFVAAWVGGFGAFAFGIIASDNYQSLVLAVVVSVALVDIAAYAVGSAIGRRRLAPVVSPKKTLEGLIGGTLMAFLAGVAASFFIEAMDLPAGVAFGAVVAVFAPLGDLAVSVAKRALNIKDMGSILPGHGGLLDRIDAIIATVPAAWAVFTWMGLL